MSSCLLLGSPHRPNIGIAAQLGLFTTDSFKVRLVYAQNRGRVKVIHAKPGDKVVIEPLTAIEFDGLYEDSFWEIKGLKYRGERIRTSDPLTPSQVR